MRACAPHRSSAAASRKPARKRKTSSFAYGAAASFTGAMPSSGKRAIGRREVAASGTGSRIHQSAIQAAMPSTRAAAGESASGASSARRMASAGPARRSASRRAGTLRTPR
jgi:hypothetical protein